MLDYTKQMNVAYPRAEEELIDFLNGCKLKDSKVLLCPRSSVVFDKEVSKEAEKIRIYTQQPNKFGKKDDKSKFVFGKREIPHKTQQIRTYVPPANVLLGKWVRPIRKIENNECK